MDRMAACIDNADGQEALTDAKEHITQQAVKGVLRHINIPPDTVGTSNHARWVLRWQVPRVNHCTVMQSIKTA